MLTYDNVLPIGSVVRLKKNPESLYAVTGYLGTVNGVTYDYLAVRYPLGERDDTAAWIFQAEEIGDVVFRGFCGEYPNVFEITRQLVASAAARAPEIEAGTELT